MTKMGAKTHTHSTSQVCALWNQDSWKYLPKTTHTTTNKVCNLNFPIKDFRPHLRPQQKRWLQTHLPALPPAQRVYLLGQLRSAPHGSAKIGLGYVLSLWLSTMTWQVLWHPAGQWLLYYRTEETTTVQQLTRGSEAPQHQCSPSYPVIFLSGRETSSS